MRARFSWLAALLLTGACPLSLEAEDKGEPVQTAAKPIRFNHGKASLTPMADFEGEFRVLSTRAYDDPMAELCPLDLALAWGPLLPLAEAEKLQVQQDQRHYAWAYYGRKWSQSDIERHSANLHLIPSTKALRSALKALKASQRIRLRGRLVDVTHPALSEPWKTSLVRTDTGTGACEILFVTGLEVVSESHPETPAHTP